MAPGTGERPPVPDPAAAKATHRLGPGAWTSEGWGQLEPTNIVFHMFCICSSLVQVLNDLKFVKQKTLKNFRALYIIVDMCAMARRPTEVWLLF